MSTHTLRQRSSPKSRTRRTRRIITARDEREDLIVLAATMLHRAGVPSHRIEAQLQSTSDALHITCTALVDLTSIWVQLPQKTHVIRPKEPELHLEKIALIEGILRDVASKHHTTSWGLQKLQTLHTRPDRYTPRTLIAAMAITGLSTAILLQGSFADSIASFFFSALVAFLYDKIKLKTHLVPLFPLLSTALVAFCTYTLHPLVALTPFCVIASSVIVFVPGLSLTIALSELTSNHTASGVSRLGYVLIYILLLGSGTLLGTHAAQALFHTLPLTTPPSALPAPLQLLAVLAAAWSFTILFKARPTDFPIILLVTVIAWTSMLLSAPLGTLISAGCTALIITLISNLHARLRNTPATVALIPGIISLVPGTVGLQSFESFATQHTLDATHTLFTMFTIALSLTAGIFLANTLLPTRRAL